MENEKIDIEKTVNHWIANSDKDYDTMSHLYKAKDYHWALFIGHIVIERLLKAGIVKETTKHAPFTHDLRRLAKLSKIEFQDRHPAWLDTITTFNLNARYDSYKQEFYKKCTLEYTTEWIKNIKELRSWIKMKL
jgi:HEPN domain-containing protein